jgi:hypothetical protein
MLKEEEGIGNPNTTGFSNQLINRFKWEAQ